MGLIRAVRFRLFCVYVCLNMLLAAMLFLPWILPRETISGFIGRCYVMGNGIVSALAALPMLAIDAVFFWERNHCIEVFKCERQARAFLYPEGR